MRSTRDNSNDCLRPSAAQPCRRGAGPGRIAPGRGSAAKSSSASRANTSAGSTATTWPSERPKICWARCSRTCNWGKSANRGGPRCGSSAPSAGEDGWWSRHSVIQIVNDDMPFLVDSTTLEINRQGLTLHLIAHPIYAVERDAQGKLEVDRAPRQDRPRRRASPGCTWRSTAWSTPSSAMRSPPASSACWPTCAPPCRTGSPCSPGCTKRSTNWSIAPANAAQGDRRRKPRLAAMAGRGPHHLAGLSPARPGAGKRRARAAPGARQRAGPAARDGARAAFGQLRRAAARRRGPWPVRRCRCWWSPKPTPAPPCTARATPTTSASSATTTSGEVIGEHRFIGLFTSTAYSARVSETPLLRGKVEAIASRAGLPPGGHLAKALDHILETYPRDDLFQIPDEDLYETALGILALGERQRLRLFVWRDPFDRFVSCLVYVPREAYSTDLRVKFQRILLPAFERHQRRIRRLAERGDAGANPLHDAYERRARCPRSSARTSSASWPRRHAAGTTSCATPWSTPRARPRDCRCSRPGAPPSPPTTAHQVAARDALPDVRKLAGLSPQAPLALALYQRDGAQPGALGLKVYRLGAPLVLSDSLPMLEHMGVRVIAESSWRIGAPGRCRADRAARLRASGAAHGRDRIRDAGPPVRRRLRPRACAARSKATISTAWCCWPAWPRKRWWCSGPTPSTSSRSALRNRRQPSQPPCPRTRAWRACWSSLFKLRFDPQRADAQAATSQVNAIEKALEKVSNMSEDLVLRQLLALVQATLRTNFWRTGRRALRRTGAAPAVPQLQAGLRPAFPACRSRARCTRSSCIRRASKASTCAAARLRAAACAGRTGPTTSAPRCWAWSRPRWSRTR